MTQVSTEFHLYDMEYLVSQYEMMNAIYDNPEQFGEQRVLKMRQAFQSYDKDGNQVLDREEVTALLQNHFKESGVNKKPTKDEVDKFFKKLDDNPDDKIDF